MIEKFRSAKDRQYYFRVRAGNRRTVLQSEGYRSAAGRDAGAAALQRLVGERGEAAFKKLGKGAGGHYFVVVSGNGKVVGKGQNYGTRRARDRGIGSVVANVCGRGPEEVADAAGPPPEARPGRVRMFCSRAVEDGVFLCRYKEGYQRGACARCPRRS